MRPSAFARRCETRFLVACGLSLDETAERTELSLGTVRMYAKGLNLNARPLTLKQIAAAKKLKEEKEPIWEEIRALVRAGYSIAEVCRRTGRNHEMVRRHTVDIRPKRPISRALTDDQIKQILAWRSSGEKWVWIASELGVAESTAIKALQRAINAAAEESAA